MKMIGGLEGSLRSETIDSALMGSSSRVPLSDGNRHAALPTRAYNIRSRRRYLYASQETEILILNFDDVYENSEPSRRGSL